MEETRFLTVYEQLADPLFRHCYYRVYDRERAKDLVQEAFLRAWEYIGKGQEVKNMRAFLYRIINNLIIDASRKKQNVSLDELREGGFEPSQDVQPQLNAAIDAEQVFRTLKQLDSDYREVFLLRYVDGLKPREIADVLGESPNTISVRLHRATRQIYTLLSYEITD